MCFSWLQLIIAAKSAGSLFFHIAHDVSLKLFFRLLMPYVINPTNKPNITVLIERDPHIGIRAEMTDVLFYA